MSPPKKPNAPPLSPSQIIYHEAGHIVVAYVEGFEVDGLRMQLKNLSGSAETRPARLGLNPEEYIRKRVRVLLAGTVAQHLSAIKDWEVPDDATKAAISNSLEYGNGCNDWRNALELVWLLRNMKAINNDDPVTEINALLQELIDETGHIVARQVLPIRRLAGAALLIYNDINPNDLMETRDEVCLLAPDVMDLIQGVAKPHEVADSHISRHRQDSHILEKNWNTDDE